MSSKLNRRPGAAELRAFGASLLAGFGLIGSLLLWRGHETLARTVWAAAGSVGILALAWPRAARPFHRAWMGLARVLGAVVSKTALLLIFYGVVTPMAVFMRLRGRDALRLKKGGESHWTEHPRITDPSDYEHLF